MITNLTGSINNLMNVAGMTLAVDVVDLSDGEHLSINGDRIYAGASLIKVPIAIHILTLIDQGELSLTDTVKLDLSLPEYNEPFGSGVITNMQSKIEITIRDLLLLSLAESDNLATNELLKFTTFERINQTLSAYGLKDTLVNTYIHDFENLKLRTSNPLTAVEIGLLYQKAFRRELPLSDLLIELLSNQKYTSRIPILLPEFDANLTISHKTGSVGTFIHDAGLVMRPEFNYSITLLGEGNKHWFTSSMVLARASEQIYAYMARKYFGETYKSISLKTLEPDEWLELA